MNQKLSLFDLDSFFDETVDQMNEKMMNDDLLLIIFDQIFNKTLSNESKKIKWLNRCKLVSKNWRSFVERYKSVNKKLDFLSDLQQASFRIDILLKKRKNFPYRPLDRVLVTVACFDQENFALV